MALAIANRYAVALADVMGRAEVPADAEAALDQLRSFHRLLTESTELNNALASPAISPQKKRQIVSQIGERIGLLTPVRNFLYVVMDHRRLGMLDEMIEAFRDHLDQLQGIARIEVSSAGALEEQQQSQLVDKFARVTGQQIRANFGVDQELLGGVVVRHGSRIYDGSVRARLEALRRNIAGEF